MTDCCHGGKNRLPAPAASPFPCSLQPNSLLFLLLLSFFFFASCLAPTSQLVFLLWLAAALLVSPVAVGCAPRSPGTSMVKQHLASGLFHL